MTMIDFEDSMTFTLDNQMNGLRTVTKAAARTLKVDVEGAAIDLSACEKTSQILIRMEGLALPNPHFLVDSIPVPCNKSRSSLDMRWAADAAAGATLEAAAEERLTNTALLPSLPPSRDENPRGSQSLPPLTPPPCSPSPLRPLFSSSTSVAPAVLSPPPAFLTAARFSP